MLKRGKEIIEVDKGMECRIDAAAQVGVIGMDKDKSPVSVLANGARLRFRIPDKICFIEVAAQAKDFWSIELLPEWFRREVPDPEPVAEMVGFEHPPTLVEQMKQFIREEISEQARDQGFDTLDEEDDFEDPDGEYLSPYEYAELQDEYIGEDGRGVEPKTDDETEEAPGEDEEDEESTRQEPAPEHVE